MGLKRLVRIGAELTMNIRKKFANPWLRIPLMLVLVFISALSFLRYLGSSFAYSATLGLDTQMAENRQAHWWAWLFLILFASLELLCTMLLVESWPSPDLGSRVLRFVARYGSGLVLTLIATGIVVALNVALLR